MSRRHDTLVVWLVLVLLLFCILHLPFMLVVEATCLRKGWSGATTDVLFGGYCTARVEQIDVVRPWLEAERR